MKMVHRNVVSLLSTSTLLLLLLVYSTPTGSVPSLPTIPPSIVKNATLSVDYEFTLIGSSKLLNCRENSSTQLPSRLWITPTKDIILNNNTKHEKEEDWDGGTSTESDQSIKTLLYNGSLLINSIVKSDFGVYRCIAEFNTYNSTHYVHLGVDPRIFSRIRDMSILVGFATCMCFLLLTLLGQLVKSLLDRFGITCNAAQKSRRLRAFFESMEQNKTSQLDWLRDNYYMQAKRIKENCFSQLEKIRESYNTQTTNLVGIKEYGTQQIQGIRDQYHDQVRKVASYSGHQLCKVRENYIFQRNRVCKFSSHQLLKIRETYKWQAQTLNKILENLPKTLNLDTCRGIGACGRADSMYLDDISESDLPLDGEDAADEYYRHFRHHHHHLHHSSKEDLDELSKAEHISLLIPPEFMVAFGATATTSTPLNVVVKNYNSPPNSSYSTPPNTSSRSNRKRQILDVSELHSLLDHKEENTRERRRRKSGGDDNDKEEYRTNQVNSQHENAEEDEEDKYASCSDIRLSFEEVVEGGEDRGGGGDGGSLNNSKKNQNQVDKDNIV